MLVSLGTLLTYLAVVAGFVFIPGPATLLAMARASSSGPRVGIATGGGIALGGIVHTILAIVGISALLAASAVMFSIVKFLGAGYLFYFGVQAIRTKSPAEAVTLTRNMSASAAFRQGVIAELFNPKTALFFLAFLPQFANPKNGPLAPQLFLLGTIFVLFGFFSTVVFSLLAGKLGEYLRKRPAAMKWQGKAVGVIYCALGVRLALQHR